MLQPYARDTFTITIDELTGDWSGWTFKGDVRTERDDEATLIASFTVDTSSLVSDGTVVFTIPASTMQTSFDVAGPLPNLHLDLRAEHSDGREQTFYRDVMQVVRNVTP